MFTGIIEDVGEVVGVEETREFRRIRVQVSPAFADLEPGASIATNGVCITACEVEGDAFTADLSKETLDRTTLKQVRVGQKVNLERSMRADDRFGGHIVQGHIDGTGKVRRFDRKGDDWILEIGYAQAFSSRLVWKGSIAVDGISLTVASLKDDALEIAIIPYTLEHTNLHDRSTGDEVNLEFDVLAKYVEKLVAPYITQLGRGTP
jgi:riboflavin synthase